MGTITGGGSGHFELSQGSFAAVQTGATLDFPGTFFQWTGGTLDGNAAAWTNTKDGTITMAGSSDKVLLGTLHNQGHVNLTTTSLLFRPDGYGALLDNQAGATFDLQSDGGLANIDDRFPGNFRNDGLLLKSGGTSAGSTITTRFTSTVGAGDQGTIHVQQGKLTTSSPAPVLLDNAGNYLAANYVGGKFLVDVGATFDPTGPGSASAIGTLTGSGHVILSHGSFASISTGATSNFPAGIFNGPAGFSMATLPGPIPASSRSLERTTRYSWERFIIRTAST